jgi:hypothetical protein
MAFTGTIVSLRDCCKHNHSVLPYPKRFLPDPYLIFRLQNAPRLV